MQTFEQTGPIINNVYCTQVCFSFVPPHLHTDTPRFKSVKIELEMDTLLKLQVSVFGVQC